MGSVEPETPKAHSSERAAESVWHPKEKRLRPQEHPTIFNAAPILGCFPLVEDVRGKESTPLFPNTGRWWNAWSGSRVGLSRWRASTILRKMTNITSVFVSSWSHYLKNLTCRCVIPAEQQLISKPKLHTASPFALNLLIESRGWHHFSWTFFTSIIPILRQLFCSRVAWLCMHSHLQFLLFLWALDSYCYNAQFLVVRLGVLFLSYFTSDCVTYMTSLFVSLSTPFFP